MKRIIELPEPDKKGSMSFEQTIISRQSCRDFSSKALSMEQISQLTWAAQGQEQGDRFRNIPSAGATYPLELFAVTETGFFHYLPGKHALEEIAKKDLRSKLCSAAWGQDFISTAPLTLVITAEFTRTTGRYGKRGIRYVYMEAGHAAQNIHLQAESLGLGSVAVGAFDDASVSSVLSLPANLESVYMVTIGYRQ